MDPIESNQSCYADDGNEDVDVSGIFSDSSFGRSQMISDDLGDGGEDDSRVIFLAVCDPDIRENCYCAEVMQCTSHLPPAISFHCSTMAMKQKLFAGFQFLTFSLTSGAKKLRRHASRIHFGKIHFGSTNLGDSLNFL